ELRVVSTHLGLRHAERRRQVERLLAHFDAEPSPFLIVLGDFNDWLPGAPAVRRLEERFGVSPRVASYPAWKPFLALDRIWVHPGSALREVSVRDTRLARRASDHLPVVARVTCPEAVDDPAGTHEKMAAGRR
ncbi:MAG: endonuclease/exonuclease/phosphatase family protein, partial [Planctomycetota bacterium JB042]